MKELVQFSSWPWSVASGLAWGVMSRLRGMRVRRRPNRCLLGPSAMLPGRCTLIGAKG